MSDVKERIAIVPGSFDPITIGHINIAKRACELYDRVYLAVMINSEKKYMFSLEEREEIARAALSEIDRIEVISSEGYLWMLAKELGACAIVKGIRNETDRQYELNMAEYNSAHYPDAETVLLQTEDSLVNISSTLVRKTIADGGDISGYLPEPALNALKNILERRACQDKK